jgi:hypothetical protein
MGHDMPDRQLVLNILRGLNRQFDHLKTFIKRTSPFPSFQSIRNNLPEELTLGDGVSGSTSSSTFYTRQQQPAPCSPCASTCRVCALLPPTPDKGKGKGKGKGKEDGSTAPSTTSVVALTPVLEEV